MKRNVHRPFQRLIKIVIGWLLSLFQRIDMIGVDTDQSDPSKKIVDEVSADFCVRSPEGWSHVSRIYRTQPYRVYEITLADGTRIECADTHILYKANPDSIVETYAKDLRKGDMLVRRHDDVEIKSIRRLPYSLCMYDISVDSPSHTYYTSDGVLNHNTTTISAFMSWMLIFHIDRNILIVANKDKTAKEIVSKIKSIFKGLPFFLKPGCEKFNESEIILDNGSKILSSATTNTASIGFTIHCILLDEFAHVPENIVNNFWRSVYPTLSSSKVSQCIITSTPNGTTNKFYEIWSGSLEGKNSFVHIRTDYWEVPGHDEAWAAQQRADFGEEEFAQEFELQFNKNSKMLIKAVDLDYIHRISREFVHKDIRVNNPYLLDEHIMWHPDFDPNDISPRDKFVFLVDLAEGNGDPDVQIKNKKKEPDYNSINIFKMILNSPSNMRMYSEESCTIKDSVRFVQVGRWCSNTEDEVYCAKVSSALAYNLFRDADYENVRIAVEMNFNGKAYTEAFKQHPLYYGGTIVSTYHTKPVPGEKQRKRLGIKTTTNKEYYCQKGNKLVHKKRIVPTDLRTYQQMQAFGYVKGKLGGIACHDDLSMPVFNHIPKLLEESSFIEWIDGFVYDHPDRDKVFRLNQIMKKWDMDNPSMSDSEFRNMYMGGNSGNMNATSNYSPQSYVPNPYSGGGLSLSNPYSGGMGANPYISGQQTLYPRMMK